MAQLALDIQQTTYTVIPNDFIDHYMCRANGEFVKIYVYLLRCRNAVPEAFSLTYIADKMNMTEGDVMRALRYWEQERLLSVQTDSTGTVTGLILLNPSAPYDAASGQTASSLVKDMDEAESEMPTNSHDHAQIPAGSHVDTEKADEATIQKLLLIAEQYLGRTLSPMDINRISYFYEDLHFSAELIEYLFEHCVTIGNRNIRYIEAVATSWKDQGIATVEEAKAKGSHYKREYFAILKAFGISGRAPIDLEIEYMNKWLDDYHFTTDVINEACQRTIAKTGKPLFPYADSILTNWKKQGILAKKDIAAADAQYHARVQAEANAKTAEKKPVRQQPKPVSRFNNFEQRDYDFNELERTLNNL